MWSPNSLLRIIAREPCRGRQRELSRSDAIVVPQHFLSTAALFVCCHAARLHGNSQHINTRAVMEEEESEHREG